MNKRGLPFLIMGIALTLLAGCAGGSKSYAELTIDQVDEQVRGTASISGMQPGDIDRLMRLYRIDASDVEDFVLYTAESNVQADELAVIKLHDAGKAEHMLEKFKQRVEAQTMKFRDYRPEEYDLIKTHVLKSRGPFVIFAVSPEAERMEQAFEEALK